MWDEMTTELHEGSQNSGIKPIPTCRIGSIVKDSSLSQVQGVPLGFFTQSHRSECGVLVLAYSRINPGPGAVKSPA